MFLMVKGAKGGVIKGETSDDAHKGEIEILSWSWGMHARPSLGGGGATGKAAVHELKVVKKIDSASTALMGALRSNELIVKAVLTLRKAARPAVGAGGATGQAAGHEWEVVKKIDRASTAQMGALRSNELIVKAVLTLRKAGKTQLEYLKKIGRALNSSH